MSWPKAMPVVEVEWIDSWAHGGWQDPEDVDGTPLKCRSVGYLLKNGPNTVVLALSQHEGGSVGDVLTIPSRCVTELRTLQGVN